jgi:hypothetical protein
MIQVQVCGRQRQRRPDYNNTSTFFFSKKKSRAKKRLSSSIVNAGVKYSYQHVKVLL